jgi:acyl-CoA synthetase (AMP-forming)/AMP-acid ligase II
MLTVLQTATDCYCQLTIIQILPVLILFVPCAMCFMSETGAGDPKGVMVTFAALHANVALIHNGFTQCFTENSGSLPSPLRGFSWLPQ